MPDLTALPRGGGSTDSAQIRRKTRCANLRRMDTRCAESSGADIGGTTACRINDLRRRCEIRCERVPSLVVSKTLETCAESRRHRRRLEVTPPAISQAGGQSASHITSRALGGTPPSDNGV